MNVAYSQEALLASARRLPDAFYRGRVSRVVGLIIEGFLPNVPVGASCCIRMKNGDTVPAEVIGLKDEYVVLMPIGDTFGIQVGDQIEPLRNETLVRVSNDLLGRVLDGCGDPIDGKSPIRAAREYPLYNPSVCPVSRRMISKPLSLGVRAIDAFLTCAEGQRIAIMAGSGVGKSVLMGMIARNAKADVNVIGLIGERGREVREFLENDLGAEGLKRSVIVIATSDAPALVRTRAAFVTTTIAEYFRDQGLSVLIMMDSLTRFAMASREVGLSLGEPPTVKGYTPSLFSTLPKLLERAGTTAGQGSITGLYTILTEGDDLQDPIADTVRSIVDGHIVLSRRIAVMGRYPAIDILQSISRVMRNVVDEKHYNDMQTVRRAIALYEDMEDYVKMGVYTPGKNPELDRALSHIEPIRSFLAQKIEEKADFSEVMSWLDRTAKELES